MARPSRWSHAIELTLFLWHMSDDATEGVAEYSSRLQPSINLHAPVTCGGDLLWFGSCRAVELLEQSVRISCMGECLQTGSGSGWGAI